MAMVFVCTNVEQIPDEARAVVGRLSCPQAEEPEIILEGAPQVFLGLSVVKKIWVPTGTPKNIKKPESIISFVDEFSLFIGFK